MQAYLCIDGYAGRREYPVEIVRETPKRYKVRLNGGECLPSGRTGVQGQEILVPRYAVRVSE